MVELLASHLFGGVSHSALKSILKIKYDELKNEDNLKNQDDLKYEDDLKTEDNLKNKIVNLNDLKK